MLYVEQMFLDKHHRAGDDEEMCARLFLREIKNAGWCELAELKYCGGRH